MAQVDPDSDEDGEVGDAQGVVAVVEGFAGLRISVVSNRFLGTRPVDHGR